MISSTICSHGKRKRRPDGLFMPEEVVRINFGLHMHQPVEVILEVLGAPNTCFFNACIGILGHPQIKVPIIEHKVSYTHKPS